MLAVYQHIENIPHSHEQWITDGVAVRGAAKLATTLADQQELARLFKVIATVVTDVADDVEIGSVDSWMWQGPTKDLGKISQKLEIADLVERAERAMVGR